MTARKFIIVTTVLVGLLAGAADEPTQAQARRVTSGVDEASRPGTNGYRRLVTREEDAESIRETALVEEPTIDGGVTTRVESEDVTRRLDAQTSLRTRTEFTTDANGRQLTTTTMEEQVTESPDGGRSVVRSFAEPDANGRTQQTRLETEVTTAQGDGRFTTLREVSVPSANGFVPAERVERQERLDGDRILAVDETTYVDQTGRGVWTPQQRRVVDRALDGDRARSVEEVYTADDRGQLVLNDRVVSREWTTAGGQEHRSEQIYTRDIQGQARAREPRLYQEVESVRTPRAGGGWTSTSSVTETRGGQTVVVERVTERARPDGRGGTVIERETQQIDLNGRLETVRVTTTQESETPAR